MKEKIKALFPIWKWARVQMLVIIVLTAIICLTIPREYGMVREMQKESGQVWEQHIERIENKKDNGEPVESSAKTESQVEPIKAKAEDLSSAPASGIEEIIYEVAKEKQFKNPEILVRIAKAESSLNPCTQNPNSSATGVFQILDMHGLSKAERCNPRIATAWAIDHFNNGNPWNSSRSKWDNS